jgi:hypothetical protein
VAQSGDQKESADERLLRVDHVAAVGADGVQAHMAQEHEKRRQPAQVVERGAQSRIEPHPHGAQPAGAPQAARLRRAGALAKARTGISRS